MTTRAQGPDGGWQAMLHRLAAHVTATDAAAEAEAYANGWRYLTVRHGDVETSDDERRLAAVRERVETTADGHVLGRTVATNDTTTWWWPPHPDTGAPADELVAALAESARGLGATWWRVSTSSTGPRGRRG